MIRISGQITLEAAILLYQAGEVTLGRAAELAGLHRFESIHCKKSPQIR